MLGGPTEVISWKLQICVRNPIAHRSIFQLSYLASDTSQSTARLSCASGVQDMLESARHDVRTLQADIESQESKVAWLTQKLHEAERNENEARRAAREANPNAINTFLLHAVGKFLAVIVRLLTCRVVWLSPLLLLQWKRPL